MPTESMPGGGERDDPEVPERWSANRKRELVLHFLGGEALKHVAREAPVPAHLLKDWPRRLRAGGRCGRRVRRDPAERALPLAQAKLRGRTMRCAHAERLSEKRGVAAAGQCSQGGRRWYAQRPGGPPPALR